MGLSTTLVDARSARVDGDFLGFVRFGARQREIQQAIPELRLDLVRIDLERKANRAAELSRFTLLPVIELTFLELLELPRAANRDRIAHDRDVDLVRLDARQLGGQNHVFRPAPYVDRGKIEA